MLFLSFVREGGREGGSTIVGEGGKMTRRRRWRQRDEKERPVKSKEMLKTL